MKKVFLLVVAASVATVSFSQVRLGAQATANYGGVSITEMGGVDKSMRLGGGIGLVSEVKLSESFALRPSLNFLQKSNAIKSNSLFSEEGDGSIDMKTTLNYLELPVNIQYSVPLQNSKLFFAAGPSLGYGISGKIKLKTVGLDDAGDKYETNSKIDAFKSEEEDGAGLKRFDFSANVLAGIETPSGLFANIGYLRSLTNKAEGEGKYKSYGFQLTLGYWFK